MTTQVVLDHAALHELLEAHNGPVGRELARRGLEVTAAAKRNCPVRTGNLRASIHSEPGQDARGIFVRIGSYVHYAIYVEMGTRYQHAQKYLRRALSVLP